MFAIVKSKSEPGLSIANVPEPEPGPNDIKIRVTHASICGTDVHIYKWDDWASKTIPVPMVVGHEYVGIIDAVGENVSKFKPGMRVAGEGHIICGVCRNCRSGHGHMCINTLGVGVNRPGAYAEAIVIPAHNAYSVPDSVPDEVAAILDPFGNAVHTALSFDLVGEDVLITGAGSIGIMAAAVCRKVGARHIVVTDFNDLRLKAALAMGASRAVHPEALASSVSELGMREGFDVCLEMSGAPTAYKDALNAMRNGAKMALLGIPAKPFPIDWNQVIFKSLFLKGIYGREMFDTWYKAIALLESGLDISPIITDVLPITEYERGFQMVMAGEAIKVVFKVDF